MSIRTALVFAAIAAAAATLSLTAAADGIAAKTARIPAAARGNLQAQIEAARASDPAAFEAVASVKMHRPEVYKHFRNPLPTAVSRELRGLGAAALMPMLQALAFDAPERGSLTDVEWDALAAGMLEATGVLRDARSAPVLHAVFESDGLRAPVIGAAARALGRLGGDAELALLTKHTAAGDARRMAAIEGLGQLRRIEAAQYLADLLQGSNDDATAAAISDALGKLGSSWAWKALGAGAAARGLATREVCARALVGGLVRNQGAARTAARDGLVMVEHPSTGGMLQSARGTASPDAVRAIDEVGPRLAQAQKPRR